MGKQIDKQISVDIDRINYLLDLSDLSSSRDMDHLSDLSSSRDMDHLSDLSSSRDMNDLSGLSS